MLAASQSVFWSNLKGFFFLYFFPFLNECDIDFSESIFINFFATIEKMSFKITFLLWHGLFFPFGFAKTAFYILTFVVSAFHRTTNVFEPRSSCINVITFCASEIKMIRFLRDDNISLRFRFWYILYHDLNFEIINVMKLITS